MNIKKDVSLAPFTTMKVGGEAKYFVRVKKIKELIEAVKKAKKEKIPYFILGGGANAIFSDSVFPGMVIKNETNEILIEGTEVLADSGVSLAVLLKKLAVRGIGGFEFLAGIPGTLGGAVLGNAGAYGKGIGQVFINSLIFSESGEIKTISRNEMNFSYRSSAPKSRIIAAGLTSYPAIIKVKLKGKEAKVEAVERQIQTIIKNRAEKQPKGYSCGSIFKNLRAGIDVAADFPAPSIEGRIAAGFLLDKAGLKGTEIGGAEVPEEHANWIVNKKQAKSEDVRKLKNIMKEKVKEKYNLDLKEEVIFVDEVL